MHPGQAIWRLILGSHGRPRARQARRMAFTVFGLSGAWRPRYCASPRHTLRPQPRLGNRCRSLAMVGPDRHRDRRPGLTSRDRIKAAIRAGSRERGLHRGRVPARLQASPGNETHLHAFATELIGPTRERPAPLSPHLARVRLQEAAGRRRGRRFSPSHPSTATASAGRCMRPEFTMLEWYRAGEPYEPLMGGLRGDCCALAAERGGRTTWSSLGASAGDPCAAGPPDRSTRRSPSYAEHRPARHLSTDGAADRDALRPPRRAAGHPHRRRTTPGPTSSAACWSRRSSPRWGNGRPTILCEYPAPRGGPRPPHARPARAVAERFELYACGVELANGFGELSRSRPSSAAASKPRWTRRRVSTASAIRWTRISWRRCRTCRRRLRLRAGLRPAGHAGDGRHQRRSGDLDTAPRWEQVTGVSFPRRMEMADG